MSVTVEVRGVEATWDGSTVSFSCEGDPIAPVAWVAPPGPRNHLVMPERYMETGFAEAVEAALTQAWGQPGS